MGLRNSRAGPSTVSQTPDETNRKNKWQNLEEFGKLCRESDCEELMGSITRNNRGDFMGFLTLKLNSPKNLVYGKNF